MICSRKNRYGLLLNFKYVIILGFISLGAIFWYITSYQVTTVSTDSLREIKVHNKYSTKIFKNVESATPFNRYNNEPSDEFKINFSNYKEALEYVVDKNDPTKTVIISTADAGYLDMTLNFYIGSIKRHNLKNFLMLCIQKESCEVFRKYGIPVFYYSTEQAGHSSSRYNSPEFKRKTHIKTRIILDALKLGFTVVISDVDIVYIKNPLKHWPCPNCDIQVSSDYVEANSGFYLVKPNEAGKKLHEEMLKRAKPNNSNQKTLNPALNFLKKQGKIKSETLTNRKWPCGIVYWENEHRMWSSDRYTSEHVLVHNNWIETAEAKIYRFKEHEMWFLNKDGYYSNPDAKYITYSNPINFGDGKTRKIEGEALADALGIAMALDRILILPAFHCDKCKYGACKSASKTCALNVRFHLQEFDKQFKNKYREHVFLNHYLVPDNIKKSVSKEIVIDNDFTENHQETYNDIPESPNRRMKPADKKNGATSEEIINWVNSQDLNKIHVLRFKGMYNAFKGFSNPEKNARYNDIIKKGLVKGGYRQYRWED